MKLFLAVNFPSFPSPFFLPFTRSRNPVNKVCIQLNFYVYPPLIKMGKMRRWVVIRMGKSFAQFFLFNWKLFLHRNGIQKKVFRCEVIKNVKKISFPSLQISVGLKHSQKMAHTKSKDDVFVLDFHFTFKWKFISLVIFSRNNRTKRARKL